MINAAVQRGTRSFRTTIGGVLTAWLLVIGFRQVADSLANPLAALLVSIINFVLEKKQPQIFPLAVPSVIWSLSLDYALTGLVVLALGLRLGFWLHREKTSSN